MSLSFYRLLVLAVLATGFLRAGTRPTVGLLVKVNTSGGFWGELASGAKEAAEAAGVDLVIRGTQNVANSEAQIKLLESFASQNIDALIITPASAERLTAPLNAAAAQGLKIVIAESELSTDEPFPFVGYDQEALASAAATAFASLLDEAAEVSILRGVSDQVVVQRDKFILARFKKVRPNLRLHLDFFAVSNEHSTAGEKAGLLLQKHPGSRLFIGTSSSSTAALLAATKSVPQMGGAKIAGFGFSLTPELVEAIEAGTLEALVCQVPREIGYKSVTTAAALIRGEKVPPKTGITSVVVTRENLHTPAMQALKPR